MKKREDFLQKKKKISFKESNCFTRLTFYIFSKRPFFSLLSSWPLKNKIALKANGGGKQQKKKMADRKCFPYLRFSSFGVCVCISFCTCVCRQFSSLFFSPYFSLKKNKKGSFKKSLSDTPLSI